jgi:hypothetical protein
VEPPRSSFVASDAWLLLALIYAGGPADRERIVRVGDGINHAIFTDEELEGGLRRLQAVGHVEGQAGRFQPTPAVLAWYEGASPKRARIEKDLERVERFLGVRGA